MPAHHSKNAAIAVATADRARLAHFLDLDGSGQAAAIRRLSAEGWSPWTIATATGLCVQAIVAALQAPDTAGTPGTTRRPQ